LELAGRFRVISRACFPHLLAREQSGLMPAALHVA
jgi:hypothetical protein